VNSVKASVDQLATAVDGQKRRVAEGGGEIAQKLKGLDATATDAQRRGELYQARSEELARRFEAMETALESKATQVSKQVDNVSIRQAYPTLGEQRFATYSNAPWKGIAGKMPNEKWVNIFISGGATPDFSVGQIEKLFADLKESAFTPFPGAFGLGGPYSTNMGSAGSSGGTAVFYFKKDFEQAASIISGIVSRALTIKTVSPRLINPAAQRDDLQFIIEHSGIDCQIFLDRPQK